MLKKVCSCEHDGFLDDERKITCPICEGLGIVDEDGEKMVFVNAYRVTREFGGHEEGGWWYNWYECLEVYPCRNKNSDLIEETLYKEYEGMKHGDIYSVLGGADIVVLTEAKPKASEESERPYYE